MKIGRNDPCPCGSGEKHKKCCLNAPNYESLYFEQMELLKKPTEENYKKIIDLGNTILGAKNTHIFSTGACTNIARASLFLYYETKNEDFIEISRSACDNALKLKSDNQQAMLVLYEVFLLTKDYCLAGKTLESIHPSVLKAAEDQILMFYQQAINEANIDYYSQQNKDDLDILTDVLFNIFKNLPALCGIATSYYMGIGNDVIKAYEVAKKCVEECPNAETYCNLGHICITPPLNRFEEAIMFLKQGIAICSNTEVMNGLKSNLLPALIKSKDLDEAKKLGDELICSKPNNLNYHNYAELLKHMGQYDEAIEWCKKALFLVEDDCTLLTLADIYRRNGMFNEAIKAYLSCFSFQDVNSNSLTFIDTDGNDMYSIASTSAIEGIKKEAFKGVIQSYVQLINYDKAKAFLILAKEFLGEQDEWDIWESVLPKLEASSQAYSEAKQALEETKNRSKMQENYFKQWALTLLQLQGNSQQIDLSQLENWTEFEFKMDLILEEMKSSIINHSTLYTNMKTQIILSYPNLDADSIEFLTTANILYDVHQNSFIDFAPIIVEYAKIVEKRLRILLVNSLTNSVKMLGQIIKEIDERPIVPYNAYLSDLRSVNELRKNSAHTGRLSRVDADAMRNILFNNGLLTRL